MEDILERLEQNLARREIRPDRFDLEALKKNLTSLKDRLPEEPKENVTREMERLALLAEDIAKKARMNELEAMARELRNRQRRLLDSLNDLKDRFDRKELEAALKELKQLEDLMRQVMEAMTKLANRLPEEFVNSPDLQGMDFQDLFQDLEEIRKKLMAGDLAGALEAAQRLMQADRFQDLKMRTALGTGPGYQFIERGDFTGIFKDMTFFTEAGVSYFNEDFRVADD